jgi:AcrR family transcriptional regulator
MVNPAPLTRHPTETRQAEIIEAVLDLSARGNPADITTADIAGELNLSQGAVFKHFPSKSAIWQAVVGWVEARLFARLEAAARRADTPLEGLGAMFMAHVKFVTEHPGVPRLIFQHLQRPEDTLLKAGVRNMLARYRKMLTDMLGEAEKQGQIAQGQDKAAAAMLYIGAIQGLAIQSMLNGSSAKMQEEARRVLKLYLQAIEAKS